MAPPPPPNADPPGVLLDPAEPGGYEPGEAEEGEVAALLLGGSVGHKVPGGGQLPDILLAAGRPAEDPLVLVPQGLVGSLQVPAGLLPAPDENK